MDHRYFLLLPVVLFMIHNGLADAILPTTVNINSPLQDQIVTSSSFIISGTFIDSNVTPSLSLSIDHGGSIGVTLSGNTWSYPITLPLGWHTATISLIDNKSQRSSSVEFLISNGHVNATRYNMILIEYSESCSKMLLHNNTSNCPTLNKLVPFDTSQKTIGTGHFINDNHGNLVRTKPQVKNYWFFFDKLDYRPVCVDCYFDFAKVGTVQIIFIEPGNFTYMTSVSNPTSRTYTTASNSTITINEIGEKTTTLNYGRYISPDCTTANLSFIPKLLSDTINYMTNGCKGTTLNMTSTLPTKHTITDPSSSMDWKYTAWKNSALNVVKTQNCITKKCIAPVNPFHNPKW